MALGVTKRPDVDTRGFLGIDLVSDRSLMQPRALRNAKNTVLELGVLQTRGGSSSIMYLPGTGTVRRLFVVDVDGTLHYLLHRGEQLFATSTLGEPSGWTAIAKLGGVAFTVVDAEGEFEEVGHAVGDAGARLLQVLFRQASGAFALELSAGIWSARPYGMDSGMTFRILASNDSGVEVLPPGTYRVRLVAIRQVAGVRTLETTYAKTVPFEDPFPEGGSEYAQVDVPEGFGLQVDVFSADSAGGAVGTTHLIAQVTRALDLYEGSAYSRNGNDPTLYFECTPIAYNPADLQEWASGGPLDPVTIYPAAASAILTVKNLWGYKPVPGHLVGACNNGLLYFAQGSRLHQAGAAGEYYHRGLYDPLTYKELDRAPTALRGMAVGLAVFQQNRTGLLPGFDMTSVVSWRDARVGVKSRNSVEVVGRNSAWALCSDGRIRLFDGYAWAETFSAPVVPASRAAHPDTVRWVFAEEAVHMIFSREPEGPREALRYHLQEQGWTNWADLTHDESIVTPDGRWYYTALGVLYEQFPRRANVFTQGNTGDLVSCEIELAPWHPSVRKNILELWRCSVEASFAYMIAAVFETNNGARVTPSTPGVPDNELLDHPEHLPWRDIAPSQAVFGNFIVCRIAWQGNGIFRGINVDLSEYDPGSAGMPGSQDLETSQLLPASLAEQVLLHLKLDQDASTALDYSGHRRDHDGASFDARQFLPDLPPGGGQRLTAPGAYLSTWKGMDYILDTGSGLRCSAPVTWEFVVRMAAGDSILSRGGDGTGRAYEINVFEEEEGLFLELLLQNPMGGLYRRFTTLEPLPVAGALQVLQVSLQDGGDRLRVFVGTLDEDVRELAVETDNTPIGGVALDGELAEFFDLLWFEGMAVPRLYGAWTYEGTGHYLLTFYAHASDRDDGREPVAVIDVWEPLAMPFVAGPVEVVSLEVDGPYGVIDILSFPAAGTLDIVGGQLIPFHDGSSFFEDSSAEVSHVRVLREARDFAGADFFHRRVREST